jgi:hypothetical protein
MPPPTGLASPKVPSERRRICASIRACARGSRNLLSGSALWPIGELRGLDRCAVLTPRRYANNLTNK